MLHKKTISGKSNKLLPVLWLDETMPYYIQRTSNNIKVSYMLFAFNLLIKSIFLTSLRVTPDGSFRIVQISQTNVMCMLNQYATLLHLTFVLLSFGQLDRYWGIFWNIKSLNYCKVSISAWLHMLKDQGFCNTFFTLIYFASILLFFWCLWVPEMKSAAPFLLFLLLPSFLTSYPLPLVSLFILSMRCV